MAAQYHRPLLTFYMPKVPAPAELGQDFRTLPVRLFLFFSVVSVLVILAKVFDATLLRIASKLDAINFG